MVFGEQTGILGPFAEILAHHCLDGAAAEGQFAFGRRPYGPLMRGHASQIALGVRQRRADVVAAEHYSFFKLIFLFEFG